MPSCESTLSLLELRLDRDSWSAAMADVTDRPVEGRGGSNGDAAGRWFHGVTCGATLTRNGEVVAPMELAVEPVLELALQLVLELRHTVIHGQKRQLQQFPS